MRKKQPNTDQFNCSLCSIGKPDMKQENLDIEGRPTLVACPHSYRKRLRTEKPCKHFQHKEV